MWVALFSHLDERKLPTPATISYSTSDCLETSISKPANGFHICTALQQPSPVSPLQHDLPLLSPTVLSAPTMLFNIPNMFSPQAFGCFLCGEHSYAWPYCSHSHFISFSAQCPSFRKVLSEHSVSDKLAILTLLIINHTLAPYLHLKWHYTVEPLTLQGLEALTPAQMKIWV